MLSPWLIVVENHFRLCAIKKETETKVIETSNKMVEIALISGVMGRLIWFQIKSGNVVWPGPATSCVMVKSSNETMKAKAPPDKMPGTSSGKVTRLKARHGVA